MSVWEGIGRVVKVAEGEAVTTETEAVGESGAVEESGDTDAPDRPPARSRRRRFLLGGVTVVLVLAGAGLLVKAQELRAAPAAANHALTDTEATTRVNGDVSSALAKIFSYTPDGTGATGRSARELLGGRAARQYTQLFAQVRERVAEQRVTLTTQSVRSGVVSLDGDSAQVLVFLDQTARRGDHKPVTSAAQLSVTARLRGDHWQIVDIKAR